MPKSSALLTPKSEPQPSSAVKLRPQDFLDLWGALKAAKALSEAAGLLDAGVPPEALDRVLGSSSLCTALVRRRLARSGGCDSQLMATLAVKASGRDSKHLPDDHPALLICRAREALSQKECAELVRHLLFLRGSLPIEGSPHGEGHGQHLRLWLCLGELMDSEDAEDIAAEAQLALKSSPLPATRVIVQNVWAKAARLRGRTLVLSLADTLFDPDLPEAFAANAVSVAAQLLLHPGRGAPERLKDAAGQSGASGYLSASGTLDEANERLLAALVGWSASYVHGPRLLASLALFHALDRKLTPATGMYLEALERQVRHASAFKRLRERVRMEDWVSSCWSAVKPSRPLDVVLNAACKQVSSDLWSPAVPLDTEGDDGPTAADEGAGGQQRRPPRPPRGSHASEVEVAICASLVDNVPNMAGLIRTSEALLGGCVEVALRNDKALKT
ncbi:TARBP1 [Symbiodinium natans]|uniref:TARBP1 protein n=1 Tax=Symbiodinium natans TaxID=878477 RepID=A0A812UXM2_9DINO|nr:TARBP1 [Symbiodinium natans]